MSGTYSHGYVLRGSFLQPLEPALQRWLEMMNDRGWLKKKGFDLPWWYNERASLSLFAGSVWQCEDGWAMEEFTVKKKKGNNPSITGRCDMAFEIGEGQYIAEAKPGWPEIEDGGALKTEPLMTILKRAVKESCEVKEEGWDAYKRIGMLFIAPCLTGKVLTKNISALPHALLTAIDADAGLDSQNIAAAWSFPKAAWRISKKNKDDDNIYPGVILLVSPAP